MGLKSEVPSGSRRLRHFSGANAPSACLHVLRAAIDHGTDLLDIGKPPPPGQIMGVRNLVACHWALAANIASLRHDVRPPHTPKPGPALIPQECRRIKRKDTNQPCCVTQITVVTAGCNRMLATDNSTTSKGEATSWFRLRRVGDLSSRSSRS